MSRKVRKKHRSRVAREILEALGELRDEVRKMRQAQPQPPIIMPLPSIPDELKEYMRPSQPTAPTPHWLEPQWGDWPPYITITC